MSVHSENTNVQEVEKPASGSDSGSVSISTAVNMSGVQQAAWPFFAAHAPASAPNANANANANALLQSYAKLMMPDFEQQSAQLLANAGADAAHTASRIALVPPPFTMPSQFVGVPGGAPMVPPFNALAQSHFMQPGGSDPQMMLPPGAQLDPSTLAALTAAAAAYQQMNGVAVCQLDFPGGARRKNATRETTSTLKAWLHEHRKNPYPTKAEKIMLAILTRMSLTQVSTWFANARRRLKKESKMNNWSSSQQRNADGRDGGAKRAETSQGSDNSIGDDGDSDNADFDVDSIDIDGECGSEDEAGNGGRACAKGLSNDADSRENAAFRYRQCSSRPHERAIDHSDRDRDHVPPPTGAKGLAMSISMTDSGAVSKAAANSAFSAARTSNNNLNPDHAQLLSQPESVANAALLLNASRQSATLSAGEQAASGRAPAQPQLPICGNEKSKIWSLVDTAVSSSSNNRLRETTSVNLPSSAAPNQMECGQDYQSPECQEFLRHFLAFSAKMQAAASTGDRLTASNGVPQLTAAAGNDLGLAAVLVPNGIANQQSDSLANAAALYLSMMKQQKGTA